ncbi:MAG TPA: PAS domain S-box protein [Syntrophorhabdaceae bacterium]|nr:PAS domain S-box protein [Syntrophorhabdaceae bacterium]
MKKVLIVDDNQEILNFLEIFLKANGYDVLTARNGKEALDVAHTTPPDIIISDIFMPIMDGFVLVKLWKEDENLKHIPFIVYTATYTDPKDEKFALDLGADLFVYKTQGPKVLLQIINEYIERKITSKPPKPLGEEMEFFRQYNEILFKKLEDKMQDLDMAYRKIKEDEEKYRTIFENSVMGIFRTTPVGTYLSVNPAGAKMYGYDSPEDMMTSVTDMAHQIYVHPQERQRLKDLLEKHGVVEGFESEHYTKDGRKIWVLMNVRAVRDAQGTIQYYDATSQDITKRKQTEEELQKEKELLLTILESNPIGISLIDSYGKYIYCNPEFTNITGYTLNDFSTGRELLEKAFPDPKKRAEAIAAWKEDKKKHGAYIDRHFQFLCADGTTKEIEIRTSFRKDFSIMTWKDVTPRIEAERALKQAKKMYHDLFENAIEGIFQSTPEGKILIVNSAEAQILGYDSPEEMIAAVTDIGKQHYVNPEDRETWKKIVQDHGVVKNFEYQQYKKDGTIIWVSLSAHAVKDDKGKILYYQGHIVDVTERKQAEDRLRRNLIGTIHALAATVEIRDPYTAGHQRRVSALARSIAQEMGLSRETIENIRMAGTIHDIGKLYIPAEILSKPTRLTPLEMDLIKVHPQAGYEILKDTGLPYPIAEMIYEHHERMDGSGYPRGLKDSEILIESYILAVADVVEAIASHRPYRPAFGLDVALNEIEENKGILYHPQVVDICLKLFREKGFAF